MESFVVRLRDWRRKVTGRSCEWVTEEEIAGDGAAETEQATGGSDGDEIAAVEEEAITVVEVFPVVFSGIENE